MPPSMWNGLPYRDDAAAERNKQKRYKAEVAEVSSLGDRIMTPDTMNGWRRKRVTIEGDPESPNSPVPGPARERALPAPWETQKRQFDITDATMTSPLIVPPARKIDTSNEGDPRSWDAEMMEMGSADTKAALFGSACDLVEPPARLTKPRRASAEVRVYHDHMPSPNHSRGSGLEAAGSKAVRYNLRTDGMRPFMTGSAVSQAFDKAPGFLPQRDFGIWDQQRICAPERAYAAVDRGGAAELHDEKRLGLPAWKPGGRKKETRQSAMYWRSPAAMSQPNLHQYGTKGVKQTSQLTRAASSLLRVP